MPSALGHAHAPPPGYIGGGDYINAQQGSRNCLKGTLSFFLLGKLVGKLAYMGGDAQHMSFFPADSEVLELDFPVAKLGP